MVNIFESMILKRIILYTENNAETRSTVQVLMLEFRAVKHDIGEWEH